MAVNASKKRDPWYWEKWRKAGALGTMPKQACLSAAKETAPKVNVVFEYISGSYLGGRFYVAYPAGDIEKVKKENSAPDSNTKIVAIGIPDAQAQTMCHSALLHSGVIEHRIQHLADDPDVPVEMIEMEANSLLMAALLGPKP